MSLILNIDCSVEGASVALARDGQIIKFRYNDAKDAGSAIHIAVGEIMNESGLRMNELSAVAVTIGPGSYTGLRVGLSAAKGFCYALNIPLITIGTLELMASAAKDQLGKEILADVDFLCPLIDARRMEAFMAIYDMQLNEIIPPGAVLLDNYNFGELLANKRVIFFGNGSFKLKNRLFYTGSIFVDNIEAGAVEMIGLSYGCYQKQAFASLAYTEPKYIKDFFTPGHKSSV